jgi:hypothetical protein
LLVSVSVLDAVMYEPRSEMSASLIVIVLLAVLIVLFCSVSVLDAVMPVPVIVSVCPDAAVETVPEPAMVNVLPDSTSIAVDVSSAMAIVWSLKAVRLLSISAVVRGLPLPVLVVIDAFVGIVLNPLYCFELFIQTYLVQDVVWFYAVLGVFGLSPGVVL